MKPSPSELQFYVVLGTVQVRKCSYICYWFSLLMTEVGINLLSLPFSRQETDSEKLNACGEVGAGLRECLQLTLLICKLSSSWGGEKRKEKSISSLFVVVENF